MQHDFVNSLTFKGPSGGVEDFTLAFQHLGNLSNVNEWKIVFVFCSIDSTLAVHTTVKAGAQFEGDLGEILAQGVEISPYIGLREKWKKKKLSFHLVITP